MTSKTVRNTTPKWKANTRIPVQLLPGNNVPNPDLTKLLSVFTGDKPDPVTTVYFSPKDEQQHGGLYYIVGKWVQPQMNIYVNRCKAIKRIDDGTGDYCICETYTTNNTFQSVANAVREGLGEEWVLVSSLDIWPAIDSDLVEDEF